MAVEVSSSQLEGHEFDTHPHPRFFFTVLGHIQDGNKTTDEGTDDHEPDHERATDLAVYFDITNGDVTSPCTSPSMSTRPDPPRSSPPSSLHQALRLGSMYTMVVGSSLRPASGVLVYALALAVPSRPARLAELEWA